MGGPAGASVANPGPGFGRATDSFGVNAPTRPSKSTGRVSSDGASKTTSELMRGWRSGLPIWISGFALLGLGAYVHGYPISLGSNFAPVWELLLVLGIILVAGATLMLFFGSGEPESLADEPTGSESVDGAPEAPGVRPYGFGEAPASISAAAIAAVPPTPDSVPIAIAGSAPLAAAPALAPGLTEPDKVLLTSTSLAGEAAPVTDRPSVPGSVRPSPVMERPGGLAVVGAATFASPRLVPAPVSSALIPGQPEIVAPPPVPIGILTLRRMFVAQLVDARVKSYVAAHSRPTDVRAATQQRIFAAGLAVKPWPAQGLEPPPVDPLFAAHGVATLTSLRFPSTSLANSPPESTGAVVIAEPAAATEASAEPSVRLAGSRENSIPLPSNAHPAAPPKGIQTLSSLWLAKYAAESRSPPPTTTSISMDVSAPLALLPGALPVPNSSPGTANPKAPVDLASTDTNEVQLTETPQDVPSKAPSIAETTLVSPIPPARAAGAEVLSATITHPAEPQTGALRALDAEPEKTAISESSRIASDASSGSLARAASAASPDVRELYRPVFEHGEWRSKRVLLPTATTLVAQPAASTSLQGRPDHGMDRPRCLVCGLGLGSEPLRCMTCGKPMCADCAGRTLWIGGRLSCPSCA